MVELLTTTGNSYHIENIIKNARQYLTLVTPYLKISDQVFARLKDADTRHVSITLIYGKTHLKNEEIKKLNQLDSITVYYCKTLHAKCYYNENNMIISSMNLYEFSERNNRELGVLVKKSDDIKFYNDTIEEIQSIINSSENEILSNNVKYNIDSFNPIEYVDIDKSDPINDASKLINSNLLEELKRVFQSYFADEDFIYNIDKEDQHVNPTLYIESENRFKIEIGHNLIFNFLSDYSSAYDLLIQSSIDNKVKLEIENFQKSYKYLRYYWNDNGLYIYNENGFSWKNNHENRVLIIKRWFERVVSTLNLIECIKRRSS